MTLSSITFPALLQDFFQRRLVTERGASAHTIASYRDTFVSTSASPFAEANAAVDGVAAIRSAR
jgi:hypothetical protein